jgi:hypothetical protein
MDQRERTLLEQSVYTHLVSAITQFISVLELSQERDTVVIFRLINLWFNNSENNEVSVPGSTSASIPIASSLHGEHTNIDNQPSHGDSNEQNITTNSNEIVFRNTTTAEIVCAVERAFDQVHQNFILNNNLQRRFYDTAYFALSA